MYFAFSVWQERKETAEFKRVQSHRLKK